MRIAIIYDGNGQIRQALEEAGHDCVGYEPRGKYFARGRQVGTGRVVPLDPRAIDFSSYDVVVVNRKKLPKWVDHECAITSTPASAANDVVAAESASLGR